MRKVLAILVVLASASHCGRPEWVIPRNGGSACMCSMVCSCSVSKSEESQAERDRCKDACDCERCAGETK
jgi:hypothetical protein